MRRKIKISPTPEPSPELVPSPGTVVVYEFGLRFSGDTRPFIATYDYTVEGALESLTRWYDPKFLESHQLVRRETEDDPWEVVNDYHHQTPTPATSEQTFIEQITQLSRYFSHLNEAINNLTNVLNGREKSSNDQR